MTRPQTIGYGLVDSRAALCAWIIEKFWSWTDCDGHPENVLTRDELLDSLMLYWESIRRMNRVLAGPVTDQVRALFRLVGYALSPHRGGWSGRRPGRGDRACRG